MKTLWACDAMLFHASLLPTPTITPCPSLTPPASRSCCSDSPTGPLATGRLPCPSSSRALFVITPQSHLRHQPTFQLPVSASPPLRQPSRFTPIAGMRMYRATLAAASIREWGNNHSLSSLSLSSKLPLSVSARTARPRYATAHEQQLKDCTDIALSILQTLSQPCAALLPSAFGGSIVRLMGIGRGLRTAC